MSALPAGSVVTWEEIQVYSHQGMDLEALEGDARLAALYRWKVGSSPRPMWFMRRASELTRPDQIDWTDFPEGRASHLAERQNS